MSPLCSSLIFQHDLNGLKNKTKGNKVTWYKTLNLRVFLRGKNNMKTKENKSCTSLWHPLNTPFTTNLLTPYLFTITVGCHIYCRTPIPWETYTPCVHVNIWGPRCSTFPSAVYWLVYSRQTGRRIHHLYRTQQRWFSKCTHTKTQLREIPNSKHAVHDWIPFFFTSSGVSNKPSVCPTVSQTVNKPQSEVVINVQRLSAGCEI